MSRGQWLWNPQKCSFLLIIFCGFAASGRFTNVLQDDAVSSRGVSAGQQPYLSPSTKIQKVSLKWSVSGTFVPIWKESLQSIPEIGSCWERDWQHANTKPLAMAVTVWTRKTKSRYWVRAAPYCITLLNIKPSIRPSYLKDRTLWAIFPFRLLCFNPEPHSHSCSSSAGEEVASNCVCLRFKKKRKKERETNSYMIPLSAGNY